MSWDDVVGSVQERHRIAMKPHVSLTNLMRPCGLPRHAIPVFLDVWLACFNCWLQISRGHLQITESLTFSGKRFDHQASSEDFPPLADAACRFPQDVHDPAAATAFFVRYMLLRSTLSRISLLQEFVVTPRRGSIGPVFSVCLSFPEADINHRLTKGLSSLSPQGGG